MNISLTCESVSVSNGGYRRVSIDAEGVELSEVLENYNINDIVKALDVEALLEAIGEDACKDYFDLINNTEEE